MNKCTETQPLMVSIRCLVYNHEPYLRQCLDGFVMQKTKFRFEAIVHDDASTDNSAAIIREYAEKYPHIIKPILETENLYSKHDGSLKRIMDSHTHGRYIALCEGDDYWTDPHKLQKQVDYMEMHPMCSLCFHAHQELNKDSFILVRRYTQLVEKCPMADIILGDGGFMATNSMVYRRDKILKKEPEWAKNAPIGDLPLMLKMATQGTVAYIDDVMSVYRINTSGSWTARSMTFRYKYNFIKRKNIMWKGYDEWTDYKYHKEVCKMRQDNWIDLFKFPFAYLKRKLYGLFNKG